MVGVVLVVTKVIVVDKLMKVVVRLPNLRSGVVSVMLYIGDPR